MSELMRLGYVVAGTWGLLYLLFSSVLLYPVRKLVWRLTPRALRSIVYAMHCAVCASFWVGAASSALVPLLVTPYWALTALVNALIVLGITKASIGRLIAFPLDVWIDNYGTDNGAEDASTTQDDNDSDRREGTA